MEKILKDNQAVRVLRLYKLLCEGKHIDSECSINFLTDHGHNMSIRTVQRDLQLLLELIEEIETKNEDGRSIYYIPKYFRNMKYNIDIKQHELLNLYMLKSHLRTFNGTNFQSEIDKLVKRLEELAPGEVIADQDMLWDQNCGQYDYSQYDYKIRSVINYIRSGDCAEVLYRSLSSNTEKKYRIYFMKLFTYAGALYVGCYEPRHKNYISLAVHGIMDINQSAKPAGQPPKFDKAKFTGNRFGVFNDKLKKVELLIDKDYKQYFENRYWHSSQKFEQMPEGDIMLGLKVPIAADFIAWLLSWSDAITVLKPVELKNIIRDKLTATLKKYKPTNVGR